MDNEVSSPSNARRRPPMEAWSTAPDRTGLGGARPTFATAVRNQPASFPPELVRWRVPSPREDEKAKRSSTNSVRSSNRSTVVQRSSRQSRGRATNKTESIEVGEELVQEKRPTLQGEMPAPELGRSHTSMTLKAELLKKEVGIANVLDFSPLRLKVMEVVASTSFDAAIGFIIMLNGVSIGFKTNSRVNLPLGCDSDCNCSANVEAVCHMPSVWVSLLDLACSIVYILELGIRFYVVRFHMFRSRWIQFDAFLVVASILDFVLRNLNMENAFLNQIMLVRLFRLAKLARSLRLIPEFQTLWLFVGGLVSSLSVQVWTALLMLIMAYLFGLMGMEFATFDMDLPMGHAYNDAVIVYFRSLPDALMTILQFFSLDSCGGIMRPIVHHKPYLFLYFISIVLLLSIGLLNLITALMVDASLAAASADKDVKKAMENERKRKQMLELRNMFGELDEDGSGELSLDELMSSPEDIQETLCEIAGTEDLQGLFEALDYDGGGTLAIDEFCDGVVKFTSSDKPMELDRLCKQVSDVLFNCRQAVQILNAESDDEDAVVSLDEGSLPKKPNPRVEALEARMDVLSLRIKSLSKDVTEIMQAMLKLFGRKQAKMAKAIAVYRMH
eukprot:TRINITY_DN72459_c0_g1_i1.p1 TRINITY_DN72459_c0_g1~~TRINITY_DN72459_c0_g1_i1.p1  ORF type:complete len:615 (+),score=106.03 TRINITY_DN72459_c0_g1_i1:31-1875(+)